MANFTCIVFKLLFLCCLFTPMYLVQAQNDPFEQALVAKSNNQTIYAHPKLGYESRLKEKLNRWAVGLAAGKLDGAPIRFAEELSRVVDDGDNLHVLPIITRGPSSNAHSLLYLRGVDLAVMNADILDFYKRDGKIKDIERRINYVMQLFISNLHILARPEINSIEELDGKKVNFDIKGTSASFSGPAMMKRLGVTVDESFLSHSVALEKMKKSDEIAAVVFVSGDPVKELQQKKWPKGFKLLRALYNEKLMDYYVPSKLTSKDYPEFISEGEHLLTVAVPTILAAYNWKPGNVRRTRVERFVQYLVDRWAVLQKPPFREKWSDINLKAEVPGWRRLPAAQKHLKLLTASILQAKADHSSDVKSSEKMKAEFGKFLRSYAKTNGVPEFTQKQKQEIYRNFYSYWQDHKRTQ